MKKAGFNPSALFAASEPGVWYDPSDLSTMYQDAAGTTPCYQPGQGQVDPPVGRILDKSGRGNHATQPTTTSRPTLSARYNLLTNSDWSGAAVGTPGTAPTGWTTSSFINTAAITGVSQLGSDYAIQITAAAQRLFFTQSFNAPAGTTFSLSCLVVENSGLSSTQIIGLTGQPSGSTINWYVNGALINGSAIPPAGARLELRLSVGATAGTPGVRFGIGASGNATGAVSIAQPDVRVTNDGVGLPPYQRVIDANTYDTMGFPLYLRFDGVDDWLQTASVDFSGTDKALVAAAARKLSDAAVGCLVELSSWGGVSGALSIQAPRTASNNLGAALRDATSVAQYSIDGVASPSSFVLRAMFNISATGITNQIGVTANGATPSLSVSSAGPVVASALANAPIYIGRRAGTSQPFNGRLYGLLIRGAATPDATIATVERHLNSKARIY